MPSSPDPRPPSDAGNLLRPTNGLVAAHEAEALTERQRMMRHFLEAYRDAHARTIAKTLGPINASQTSSLQNAVARIQKSGAADGGGLRCRPAETRRGRPGEVQRHADARDAERAGGLRQDRIGRAEDQHGAIAGLQDMLRRLYDDETSRPKVIATPVAPKKRPRRGPQTAAPARALPIYTRKEIERRRRADEALVVLPGGIEGVQSTLQVVCALLEEMTARARAAEDREQAAEARAVAAEAREARGERREVVMLRMTVLAVILGIGAIIGGPMLVSWVVGTATWLAETGGRIH